ncbi:MAG: DUF5009 domain-containing protein [Bacteroidales bacterium]|nr:DUF5009 domain-containing protein [Bacteroidales bacterium]
MENKSERLLSLDFFRGLTMFLLVAESVYLFPLLMTPELEGTPLYFIGKQLHHQEWAGLHFWDLVQPFFMFIVGVAMPFSFSRRTSQGHTRRQLTLHVLKRSFLLLFLGWALYCIGPGKITFQFQNVLAQLSVTYLIAYLIMRKAPWVQILVSVLLIGLTEALYRLFWVPGFTNPFTPGESFGAGFNILISGFEVVDHWAMFNAIPTAAHTIWGVLVGQLLISSKPWQKKIRIMVIAGVVALAIGYSLTPLTPIIKRIATSTFVFVSGGWTLLAMALFYWIIDVLKFRKILFFNIVGMNPLFIYLFASVGGSSLIRTIVKPFSYGLFSWAGTWTADLITGLTVLFLLWYICFWLYKKKIFIRI